MNLHQIDVSTARANAEVVALRDKLNADALAERIAYNTATAAFHAARKAEGAAKLIAANAR